MKNNIRLSIIYVYYNTPREIDESLSSIEAALGTIPYEAIIIDNNSHISLPKSVLMNPYVRIIRNKQNRGYGSALNQGANVSRGEYILCSNTDVIYLEDSISSLLEKISSDPNIGVIGPKMLDTAGSRLQTASLYPLFPQNIILYTFLRHLPFFRDIRAAYHYEGISVRERAVKAIGGACMLFRKDVFLQVGGFDERFFLYFEEADICKRLNEAGYKVVYFPKAKVVHHVGRSIGDKEKIQHHFERSRFLFIKSHQSSLVAFISESIIRSLSATNIVLIGIFSLSLFLNLYRISELMMFFGDFGRDMFVARDILLYGELPLVGIPSSVVWLHQGPLSIYLIAISFIIGGFAPWVPAILYAVMGSITSIIVYLLGKDLWNKNVGLMSAFIFSTSPLVIVNARIPYHTAPTPFFSALFFLTIFWYLRNRSLHLLFVTGLLFGLLFQLELSNGVLMFFLITLAIFYRVRFTMRDLGIFFSGLLLGILPVFLYDLTHRFMQTLGFVAWVFNRVRLFLGLTISGSSTTAHAPDAINIVWEHLVRFIFPLSEYVTACIVVAGCIMFVLYSRERFRRKDISTVILTFGLLIPLVGFVIHARPGAAYFPLVFPLLSIAVALLVYRLNKRFPMIVLFFLLLEIVNVTFILKYSYLLDIGLQKGASIHDWDYGLGPSLKEQKDAVTFIKKDARNQPIQLLPGGFLSDFQTGIDNYRYLAWWEGVRLDERGNSYTIFQDFSEIPDPSDIAYKSDNIAVVRNE